MTVENFEAGYVVFANTALNRPETTPNVDALFKQRENYINLILRQLDAYFPMDPTDDLDILDPSHWPEANIETYGNENLTNMNSQLKWNYDEDELVKSWTALKLSLSKHPEFPQKKSSLNPEDFWAFYLQEVSIEWSQGLRNIIKNVITIPSSTAEVERVFSYYTQTKTPRRYNLEIDTVDALIRIRFNGPASVQDFDTFRYVWEFLDGHSRSDDLSVCAHRNYRSKELQEVCQATEQGTSSEVHIDGSVQTDASGAAKSSWNVPTSSFLSSHEYDVSDRVDDEFDYDISGILDAIELEGEQEEAP